MPGTQPPSAAMATASAAIHGLVTTNLKNRNAVTPEEPAFAAGGGCVPGETFRQMRFGYCLLAGCCTARSSESHICK